MSTLVRFVALLLHCILAFFRSREEQVIVELALRQQLSVYAQGRPRPRLSPLDRAFWVALSRLWPSWKDHLVVVRPETVVRWHREGFRKYWQQQRWMTFLRNHKDVIAGMDFFVVPTVRFRLLYVWFAIDHGRRRILHFNVTESPTSRWVIQQLRETFPNEPAHRYLIYDNDAIFSPAVTSAMKSFGGDPKRTAFRSPWQNGTAERVVGSVRRELLDHVIVLNEDPLRRLLREYVDYYNAERVHTSISDAPDGRDVESRPSEHARVVGLPRVGGLHHRYRWREAA
jgi:transposase InsO family protein